MCSRLAAVWRMWNRHAPGWGRREGLRQWSVGEAGIQQSGVGGASIQQSGVGGAGIQQSGVGGAGLQQSGVGEAGIQPVSYTHLTLPTKLSV